MFCRYCGQEIDDDSKFCNQCGRKLNTSDDDNQIEELENISEKNTTYPTEKTEEGIGCGTAFFICLFVIIAIIAFAFVVVKLDQNSDSTGSIFDKIVERDIRKSDYSVSTSQDLTTYSVTIRPNTKFNSCTVECKLYNSKGRVIYSDTITKEDLMANSSYTYTFNFGFTNSLSGSKIEYKVSGKCVD